MPSKKVINISSLVFTPEEINTLSKGLEFTVSPKDIPFESIICNIKDGTQGLSLDDKEVLRQECSLIMMKAKPPKGNLNKEGQVALRSLRNNDKIVVLKADKGGETIILDKDDYIHKMKENLNCDSYRRLNSNPIPKVIK